MDNELQNITGNENNTLHSAGVDLGVIPIDEKSDDITSEELNLDGAPDVKKDEDLRNIGLTFNSSPSVPPPDLNVLREQMDKKDLPKSLPKTAPEDIVATDNLEKDNMLSNQKTYIIATPKQSESVKPEVANTKDLEAEFQKTISVSGEPALGGALSDKVFSLQSMLDRVKQKLGIKKIEVKKELENLKKVKEDIAKDIENIKELEESEKKIEEELGKIAQIKDEIKNIEEEVGQELNL